MKRLLTILFLFFACLAKAQSSGVESFWSSDALAYQPEALTYIQVWETQNGAPMPAAQKDAVNTYVTGLKGAGLWVKMYFIHPMIGTAAQTQGLNLVQPLKNNLNFSGSVTFDGSGATPTVTASANTYLFFRTDTVQNNYAMGVYSNQAPGSAYATMGMQSGGPAFYIRFTDGKMITIMSGANTVDIRTAVAAGEGFSLFTSSDVVRQYKNGTLIATGSVTIQNGVGATPIALWPINNSTQRVCLDFMSKALTQSEVATFSTLTNQFMASLGRSVY